MATRRWTENMDAGLVELWCRHTVHVFWATFESICTSISFCWRVQDCADDEGFVSIVANTCLRGFQTDLYWLMSISTTACWARWAVFTLHSVRSQVGQQALALRRRRLTCTVWTGINNSISKIVQGITSLFVQSWQQRQFVLFFLGTKKSKVSEDLSLLIKISSPEPHTAPLTEKVIHRSMKIIVNIWIFHYCSQLQFDYSISCCDWYWFSPISSSACKKN